MIVDVVDAFVEKKFGRKLTDEEKKELRSACQQIVVTQKVVVKKPGHIGFEKSGKSGELLEAVFQPAVLFRGNRLQLVATGDGVFLEDVTIGIKPQLPKEALPMPISLFGPEVTNNEILFDNCQPAQSIKIKFCFDRDCTVYGLISGEYVK